MDPNAVASTTQLLVFLGLGKYTAGILSLVPLASMASAAIVALVPAPKAGIGAKIWAVLNWVALNLGHAKNAEATPPSPTPDKK